MSEYVKFQPDAKELSSEEEKKLRGLIDQVVNPQYLQEAQDRDVGSGSALRASTHPGFAESEEARFEIFGWNESKQSEIDIVLERLIGQLAGQYRREALTGDAAKAARQQAFEAIEALVLSKEQ